MTKLIILLILGYIGYRLTRKLVQNKLKKLFPRYHAKKEAVERESQEREAQKKREQNLEQCSVCGAWTAADEALHKGGKTYCGTDCLGKE